MKLEKVRVIPEEKGDGFPCEALVYDIETKKAVCLIHDKKEKICKIYPTTPEEVIFQGCGFSFEGG